MKQYFLASVLLGLMLMNFTSTPIQAMEISRIKSSLPFQLVTNNLYPLVFWGTTSFIGVYTAKTLYNYFWRDKERVYEVDGITKVIISTWPYAALREYRAVIKNSKTNQIYGSLIYQVQSRDEVYIRRFVVDSNYRKQGWGSKLLQAVLAQLPSLYGCKKVTLKAEPLELKEQETPQHMLPKLIKFYQKQGARVIRTEGNGPWMEFDLTKQV